ncbi:MAG: crosslink repair DNA glycosylase YcaQ family protein [Myxococcota bacterium]
MTPLSVQPEDLRRVLVRQQGLERLAPASDSATLDVLGQLGMIQLDPIDRYGSSPDLVVHARVRGHRRGTAFSSLPAGATFEHYAKELCLLPASVFPSYKQMLQDNPTYRQGSRVRALPPSLLDEVYTEIRERGPSTTRQLQDRGEASAQTWTGWVGTKRQTTLAVRALWLQCRLVPVGREGRNRVWDVPERALGPQCTAPVAPEWRSQLLQDRIRAAAVLPMSSGPWWGGLRPHKAQLTQALLKQGAAVQVRLDGSRKSWLCAHDPRPSPPLDCDEHMRVIAPLDPLVWDRTLVERVFGARYVWEIYKPEAVREWGYYVCPLLHKGRWVGRFEAHREGPDLVLDRLWKESPNFDEDAWNACFERLQAFQ